MYLICRSAKIADVSTLCPFTVTECIVHNTFFCTLFCKGKRKSSSVPAGSCPFSNQKQMSMDRNNQVYLFCGPNQWSLSWLITYYILPSTKYPLSILLAFRADGNFGNLILRSTVQSFNWNDLLEIFRKEVVGNRILIFQNSQIMIFHFHFDTIFLISRFFFITWIYKYKVQICQCIYISIF